MYFPILIDWTRPFRILEFLGGIFQFYSNFRRLLLYATSGKPDQTPRFVTSDLVLHCLPMSHKKNARLKRVKFYLFLILKMLIKQADMLASRMSFYASSDRE